MKTVISTFLIIFISALARAEVTDIEDLGVTSITSPYTPSYLAASPDGSAIVGWGGRRQNTSFLWTRESGRSIDLGAIVELPPGPVPFETFAYAVSNGGQRVVGLAAGGGAFRWSPEGSQVLGNLPGGGGSGVARGIGADGSVVVGFANDASGNAKAFRWTEASGMESLGTLPGDLTSRALGISSDGSVILGTSGSNAQTETQRIFRWTREGGMVDLGEVTGMITGVSADSGVVVGEVESEAFRWTAESGRQGLGRFPEEGYNTGNAVSADGRVIVGWGTDGLRPGTGTSVPFVHYDGQLVRLEALLVDEGVDLSAWDYIGEAEFVVSQGGGKYLIGGTGTKPRDDGFQSVPRIYLATVCLDEEEPPALEGGWSLHNALGWVFDTRTGWQYSDSLKTWFYIDGIWGWNPQDGWHYLGFPNWIWRARDSHWIQVS